MFDWSELETSQNYKYRSFEELCYQIAKGLYGEKGSFTPVDDSGGGDGVEFYLTFPNGDQWGWQAKFYYPNKRLTNSRKSAIINSLKKSCEVHPRLKKWILCTPTNFTPRKGRSQGEQVWFDNTLRQSIPENMNVDLEHWGHSEFNTWLSKPRFRGKLHYFFDKLELDFKWFKTQFEIEKAELKKQYDSSLHTDIDVEIDIHALLGDHAFVEHITESIEKLEEELEDLKDAVDNLNKPIQKDIVWDAAKKDKVANAAKPLQDTVINTIDQFKQAKEFLKENMLYEAQAINWDCVFKKLEDVLSTYRTAIDKSDISEIEYTGESEYKARILDDTRWLVHRPESIIANLLDDFLNFEIYKCKLLNHSELKIFGNAGVGKTHIACNICDNRLRNGLPALFVRGFLFTDNQSIGAQLHKKLDIPASYSFQDFLQALSAAAEAYNTRIPLFIDGLNEATDNGTLSKVWQKYLKGFIYEITQTKNVVLITTCRSSYKNVIWDDEYPPYSVDVEGFETDEVTQEAIVKYSKVYNIEPNLTLAPLTQFKHPIYLKIYFESKKRSINSEKSDYIGEQALFEIFDEYLVVCNQAICESRNRHESISIVQTKLNKIAEYLWTNRCRHIPFEKLAYIVDGKPLDELDWDSSKSQAILNEDLLVYRDWGQFGESVYFTYDLLGGYLIAKYLIEQAADDVPGFLNSEKVVGALFSEDYETLHPMHEDISRCLAALIPSETGEYLHNLSENIIACYFSIRSLFEISPKYITDNCVDRISHIFLERPDSRIPLLKLAESTVGHPNHPFNALFWSKQLSALSMSERDLSWTEHVRKNREKFEKIVIRIEETCQNQDISELSAKRLHLLAEYTMWILTSTVRPLRDQATRALYWYGRRFPKDFFDLVVKSFTINDPYVSERMLAATYGIAMARQHDFKDASFVTEVLPSYGKQFYENMFKPNAPHATTHILARDYAKRTVDIALMHHPNLLTADERERITPPFTDGGIQEWGESENREEGTPPIQMDFDIYTLKGLIRYDNRNPNEHKRIKANVYWRIYDLGFSLDSFREIDGLLLTENYRKYSRSGDGRKTDRYGKKYSWIAYFELAGFRQDQGILPDYNDNSRCIEVDIDPSFPDEQREYNLVKEDFLGDREASTEQWVLKTPHPDLTPYLNVDQLWDEQGSWVLLHGQLGQEDKPASRKMSAWMQGLIVKPENVDEIVDILKRQENIDGHTVPFIPEDYRTYAGEIPWCDTYPPNNWQEFSFLVRKYTIPKKQFELLRGGEPISLIDDFELWDTTKKLIEKDDEQRLNELLRERNLEIKIKTVDEEKFEHKDFEVLVPVRYNCCEESRSAANPRRSIALPNMEISDCLNLYKKPQSFDLFEKDSNRRASISFEYGDIWSNSQNFTYLRRDLLDNFLAKIDGELIWVIWGNRLLVSENYDGPYKNFQEVKTYREIQETLGNS